MLTKDARFLKIRDLFAQAIDLDAEAREQLIRNECADDLALASEIRNLLNVDATIHTGKVTRAVMAAKAGASHFGELLGTTVGAYRLISVLGRGGAGMVFLGERADRKYTAKVAVKVLDGRDAQGGLEHFSSEREILATLDHPNIARLIDAGETAERQPYLVMDYVHGLTIDRHCDERLLPITDRLRLFMKICAAVHHAHQNLIVHRDLKPSNILVTHDGTPKLLDFGIAKLLATGGANAPLTRLNDRILTPEYASPEQISGKPITTASDIYALGVLLYELISGLPPYSLNTKNSLELERAVCELDPPKPSTAIAALVAVADSIEGERAKRSAFNRSLTPVRLCDELSGDLDAIVMKALRKEPEQRYASADALATDIDRHLHHEPVLARQGNWLYFSRRFLRRHAIPVAAGIVVVVALALSVAVTYFQYRESQVERTRAERVSRFLASIFEQADPYATRGHEPTIREVLDEGSRRISDLKDDPEVRARLLSQMGAAYQNLGYYAQAVEHFENALRIRRELSNGDGADIPLLLVNLAEAQRGMGNFPASEKLLSEALAGVKAHKIGPSIEHADLLRAIGRLEHTRGDLDGAERNYKESVGMLRSLGATASPQLGRSLSALAALYSWKNDLPAAERNGREALAILQDTVPARHPDRIFAQLALGDVLFEEKHLDEAGSLIEDVVLAQRSLYGNAGPQLAQSLTFLAWVREAQGRPAETEAHLNEALVCVERSLGIEHYEVGYAHTSIARFLVHAHRYDEASAHASRALVIFAKALPEDHQYVASAQYWLGESLLGRHRYIEAVEVLGKALEIWKAAHATQWLASRTESALGAALIGAGDHAKGERMVRESYYTLLKERGADHEATKTALGRFKESSNSAGQTGPIQK